MLIREFESKVYYLTNRRLLTIYSGQSPRNLYKKGHVTAEGHVPSKEATGDNLRAIVNL